MNNELYHYGVLGMKWGKRKAQPVSDIQKRVNSTKAEYKSAKKAYNKSFTKAYNKAAAAYSPSKKHRVANDARWDQASKDAERVKSTKSAYKQAKKEQKQAINKAYKQISSTESRKIGFHYNSATYKKAAKNMVNKGMDQKTAVSKAKASAWRNTGLAIAGQVVYANRDKIASGFKKYANDKAMQKVNESLGKIGTMKLVKVAGDVYEYRMK